VRDAAKELVVAIQRVAGTAAVESILSLLRPIQVNEYKAAFSAGEEVAEKEKKQVWLIYPQFIKNPVICYTLLFILSTNNSNYEFITFKSRVVFVHNVNDCSETASRR